MGGGGGGRRDSRERSPARRKGAGRGRDRYDDGGRYDDRDVGYREGRGGGSDDEEPLGTSTIWIGGCPQNVTERDIERVTSRFGTVHKVTMKTSSRDTFCFVQYGTERNARDAIRQLDQTRPFGDGVIKVATANKKPTAGNRTDEGYNNNNRDGGRGNDTRGGRRGDSRDVRRGRYNDRDDRGYDDRDRSFDNRDRGYDRGGYRRDDRKYNDRNDRRGDAREGGRSYNRAGQDRGGGRPGYAQGGRKDSRSPPASRANNRQTADRGNRPVKVYLSQLPRDMEEDELMEVASEYGEVLSHSLERQGAYKFGWVTYAKKSEAETAIQELDDRQMQGWHMRLQAYMYPTG